MTSRVEFIKRGSGNYTILYRNSSIELGEFLMGDDGYYSFWVSDMNFAEDMLKDISDKLIELNKEWDEQIKSDLAISDKDVGEGIIMTTECLTGNNQHTRKEMK